MPVLGGLSVHNYAADNGVMQSNNGSRLKELREVAGLSQLALADEFGVDRSFLSLVENGWRQLPAATYRQIESFLMTHAKERYWRLMLPDPSNP